MGAILTMLGMLAYFLAGVISLIVCIQILADVGGIFLVLLAIFLFPVALGVAPMIPLFTEGDWIPALVVYGSGFIGMLLTAAGGALAERSDS